MEDIRVYLMERWAENRRKIEAYEGDILPRIVKRLRKEKSYTNMWLPR
jgi:hypothetical protein